jgi:hypothetical protein
MFSPDTPTLATTNSQATGEIPSFLVYGPKPAFPWKPLWAPHGSSILMSLCRNRCAVKTWTSPTNAGGKQ